MDSNKNQNIIRRGIEATCDGLLRFVLAFLVANCFAPLALDALLAHPPQQ